MCVYQRANRMMLTYIHFSFLGSLVISVYAVCPDITATVTPDLDDPEGKGQFGISGIFRTGTCNY